MSNWGIRTSLGVGVAVIGVFLAIPMIMGFQKPFIETVQHGFRGTGMDIVYNDETLAANVAANKIPGYLPQLPPVGPKASAIYKNVQVLGDLSVGQFTRLMASITQWVAPKQGCNYCHNPANMAEDSHYTKVVARRMLQMTQNINQNWTTHVAATGVTCYTCHRGNNIPSNLWVNSTAPVGSDSGMGMAAMTPGKNAPAEAAGLASLPSDPFTPFLEQAANIRVNSTTALPTGDLSSIKQTDWTYALMMHMSNALGVNCTYCHNTRAFSNWEQSPPQRVTAWYGIRMVREMNVGYLDGLGSVFPDYRKGPMGDVAKVNCATCHQGVFKPLYGVSMAKDFPELQKVSSANGGPRAP
jgi:photosynthetic reaction center cytochrome c subunit